MTAPFLLLATLAAFSAWHAIAGAWVAAPICAAAVLGLAVLDHDRRAQ